MNRIARYENVENTDELLTRYTLLQSALSPFPKRISQLYAIPKVPEQGVIEWYSPVAGQPVPYDDLPIEEQQAVVHNLKEILQSIKTVSASTANESREILDQISNYPVSSSLYAINGTPIIALGEQLRTPPVIVPPPIAPVPAKRGCLIPLILLLLLLLLLAAAGYYLWDYWKKNGHFPFMPVPAEVTHAQISDTPASLPLIPVKSHLPLILADIPKPPVAPEPAPIPEPIPEPVPEPVAEPLKVEPKVLTEKEKKIAECKIRKKKKQQEKTDMMLVFDASYSMMINMNATPEGIELWERDIPVPGIEDEPRRVSVAKDASKKVLNQLPSNVNVGLVTAFDCNNVKLSNMVSANKRNTIINQINGITPLGATALAEGLSLAGSKLNPAKESMIVVISDGKETCDGDPCAVAKALANAHPKLKINVIDIMGAGAGYCLAEATGGQVFTAKNTNQINTMLKAATKELEDEECE
ncbi:vWA domain-containing protein [Thorsellia anophelis]|uniref:Protein TonB, links inner and outer membranes n=1 Tax=Thorsellia anophelis DSM 18579 TaxID=1123402 RepID=A0A1H9ZRW5_9GAMM|nr:VWA domain-containing protein [Thorsellia anophelis]SES84391.1 protein TonB, links inner and outer membranes [Thorsellia anophelis DSM 18579]